MFHSAKAMVGYVASVVAACFCLLTVAQFTRPLIAITGHSLPGASTPYHELSRHTFEEVSGNNVDFAVPAIPQLGDADGAHAPQPRLMQARWNEYASVWQERPGPIHRRILPPSPDDGH